MLLMAFHSPAGALAFNGQHTAGSHVDRSRQPCLDSPGFDSTLPQSGFCLVFLPQPTRQPLRSNRMAYADTPSEFRLYNRPPPLS